MNNILLLSAGRRVELAQAFATELAARNIHAMLCATDFAPELSAACHVVDISVKAPRVTDPGYVDFLIDTRVHYQIGLVIPTIDTELLLLADHREEFDQRGINLVISDASLVGSCR